jgi:hypothetical protein
MIIDFKLKGRGCDCILFFLSIFVEKNHNDKLSKKHGSIYTEQE